MDSTDVSSASGPRDLLCKCLCKHVETSDDLYDLPYSNLSKTCGSYVLVDSRLALHNLRKEKMQN